MPKKTDKKNKDKELKGAMKEPRQPPADTQPTEPSSAQHLDQPAVGVETNQGSSSTLPAPGPSSGGPAALPAAGPSSGGPPPPPLAGLQRAQPPDKLPVKQQTLENDKETSKPSLQKTPDSIDHETLKDLLECPVCLRVPRSTPIFQCARGHVVCSECKPKVTTCPQCRDVLGNIRSLVSEKVLEKLPASCKYADNGCEIEVMRNLLVEHESTCNYRLVNCVDLACQQRVSLANLLTHLDSDHETEDFVRVEGGEYSSHFIVNEEDFHKDIMWISDQLHYDGKYFYRECCRSNKGLWYIWVYELAPESQATSQYTCQISINSREGEDSLSCRSRPLSLDNTKEKIAESGRGLIFTDSTARLFWEDNKVRYSVSIQKKSKT